jgi:hypothetical protein
LRPGGSRRLSGAYQDGVLSTIYVDTAKGELRQEPFFEEQVLAGALTDLEIVRRYETDLERVTGRTGFDDKVRGFKEQLVGRVAVEKPGPTGRLSGGLRKHHARCLSGRAAVAGRRPELRRDPRHDLGPVVPQRPEGHGWAVIPEVSQTSTPSVDANGRLFQLTAYTGNVSPADCLPPGSYRVELFVNGRLAAEAQSTPDFGDFDAFMARDLTAAYCRPHDWVRRDDRLPGLIDGYQSPDGTFGAYLARYNLPNSLRTHRRRCGPDGGRHDRIVRNVVSLRANL